MTCHTTVNRANCVHHHDAEREKEEKTGGTLKEKLSREKLGTGRFIVGQPQNRTPSARQEHAREGVQCARTVRGEAEAQYLPSVTRFLHVYLLFRLHVILCFFEAVGYCLGIGWDFGSAKRDPLCPILSSGTCGPPTYANLAGVVGSIRLDSIQSKPVQLQCGEKGKKKTQGLAYSTPL